MDTSVVEVINVSKIYNQGKLNEVTAVKDTSLKINKGSLVVLKGSSGSGKTTLLSLIGCQTKPTTGEVIIQGKNISKLPEKFMNLHKRKNIGFIFQHFQLISGMSVLDNIMLPLIPEGVSLKKRNKRANQLLEQFNLVHRGQFKTSRLSGGEQQRVAIARALINNPGIILADEPSAHLDSALTNDLLDYIKQLKQSDRTILITSHDPVIYQNSIVDQVFEMKDGQIIAS